ncbi:MAG: hypothetical protein SGPRY_006005 [Prymnesium sp.]
MPMLRELTREQEGKIRQIESSIREFRVILNQKSHKITKLSRQMALTQEAIAAQLRQAGPQASS